MFHLSAALLRNRHTASPKARRITLITCLTFMALFTFSSSNIFAASVMPTSAATSGVMSMVKPIDAPLHVGSTDCSMATGVPTTECDVLLSLFADNNGSVWTTKNGWNITNTPCTWTGITCTVGHVTSLVLHDNNLSGSIPDLAGLPNLRTLDLSFNQLRDTIPSFAGLPNLQNLVLTSIPSPK